MNRITFNRNKINQLLPNLIGVNTNLNIGPEGDSASRLYMEGNMVAKSVVVSGASTRKIISGFEKQYGDAARSITAPSDMTVEEVFCVRSSEGDGILTDGWKEIFVVFKNEDKDCYDVLALPRFNTQNLYVGFEYVYDKDMVRRLVKGATFAKGEIFARSPRISPSGEWMFGVETLVCPMSSHETEEDGIVMSDRYASEKLRCMFKHDRSFEYNEDEWIPLFLYDTDTDDPRPFARPGGRIRKDGIVMGFRRRAGCNPLVSLTQKGLTEPDYLYDKLFYAPPSSILMDISVEADILKDRSHNRNTDQIPQPHNEVLKEQEAMQNAFYNEIISWYEKAIVKNGGVEPPATYQLDKFICDAYGKYTKRNNQVNKLKYSYKNIKQKDWKIKVLLKEEVEGRVKFKVAGLNGDKGVIVKIKPWQEMPHYPGGAYADVIINNTPAFRRQIMTMLNEMTINFINLNVYNEIEAFWNNKEYKKAWEKLLDFYTLGFPEYGELIIHNHTNDEEKLSHLKYIIDNGIEVQKRSDSEVYGINVIRQLRTVFKYRPRTVFFTDSFGNEVESHYPIMITSMYLMLLDKFGSDDSSQAFPKTNPFGLPTSNSQADKYTKWYIDKGTRNMGEGETRWENVQKGPKENIKQLALANSEVVRNNAIKRIIRADDPFDIDTIVKDEELVTNRALLLGADMLSDSGYCLRHERPEDREQGQ